MVQVPIVEKKEGQIVSTMPDRVQIMDLESFEVFEVPKPNESELKEKLSSGKEVEYWRVLGKSKIMRVKG